MLSAGLRVANFVQEGSSARRPPPGRPTRTVKFQLPLQTKWGEHVGLVGSFRGPQGWDPATPLRLEWSEGSVWVGEAELPVGEPVEYKYVLHSERDGSLAWQPGANRSLNLGADGAPALVVLDDWAGPRHEVTPAEPAAAEASQEEPQPEAPLAAAQPEPSEGATAAAAEQRPQPEAAHPGEVEAAAEQPALAAAALAAPAKGPKPTAEASWQAALAVANQPVVVPHPPAPAAAEEPPVPAGKPAEQPKASAESSWQTVRDVANQPHVPAKPAPAAAASKGAVLAAREELAPVVAPAADAPAQRSLPRWLRLALAAALVLAAVIAFLRSPFAAARWALLHC